jgi:hypothetical protein
MSSAVQVGAILLKDWPGMAQPFPLESEPSSGGWSLIDKPDGISLDRKIHTAGWNFFFMAAEIKVSFFGAIGAAKIQNALRRILAKVKPQNFNGLEITGIVAKHFLGVPYVTVSAHSRHMQKSCYLDSCEERQAVHEKSESGKG